MAADIKGWFRTERYTRVLIDPQVIYDHIDRKFPDSYGLGIYANRVHIDTRRRRVRWDER